jgi:hypothetical protein
MHIFNPDYLIDIANVLILVAFIVRDVLLLRLLFLVGSVFAIGFYFCSHRPSGTPSPGRFCIAQFMATGLCAF